MMNETSLRLRLQDLSESLKQSQQLIVRLSKLSLQTGSSSSSTEFDSCTELSAEIHQSLKEQEEEYELFKQEAEDITKGVALSRKGQKPDSGRDRENSDLANFSANLGEDLKIARAQFRKAQLQTRKNAEIAKRRERESLFAEIQGGQNPHILSYGTRKGQERLSQEEVLLGASSDVTAALRRTHQLMSTELERSQFARETLETSTKELSTLTDTYSTLDDLLSSSRSLVSTLLHSQKSDTWYLETAFYVLIATIGWLVFRRIIYGPGWWFLYFPLRTIWWASATTVSIIFGIPAKLIGSGPAKNPSFGPEQVSEPSVSSLEQSYGAVGVGGTILSTNMPSSDLRPTSNGGGVDGHADGHADGKSLSDRVGAIIESSERESKGFVAESTKGTEKEGTILRERSTEDGPPNPKKRMWEEPVVDQGQRDEL